MRPNTSGSVAKRRPGPLPGSSPNANTAGKMTSPASSPAHRSPPAVSAALPRSGSPRFRYEPYTTMNVPPSERLKIAWPSAANMTGGVSAPGSNAPRYQRSPSPAPGSVSERTMRMTSPARSAGTMRRLARSIPRRSPRRSTAAQVRRTTPVQAHCRRRERSEKPSSGGRIAAASISMPTPESSPAKA